MKSKNCEGTNWGAGIRFHAPHWFEYEVDTAQLVVDGVGEIHISAADPRLAGLSDPKFRIPALGRTGSQLYAELTFRGDIQEAYRRGLLLQYGFLSMATKTGYCFEPGLSILALDGPKNNNELAERFSNPLSHPGLELFQGSPGLVARAGVSSEFKLTQNIADKWSGIISETTSAGLFTDEVVNALILQNHGKSASTLLRLVTSVSSIEALVGRQSSDQAICELIPELLELVNSKNLEMLELNSLKGRIQDLKYLSIAQACIRYLAKKVAQERIIYYTEIYSYEPILLFKKAYAFRCKILHEGIAPDRSITTIEDSDDFWNIQLGIEELASELIKGEITANSSSDPNP